MWPPMRDIVSKMYCRISSATGCNCSGDSRRRSAGELILSRRSIARYCNVAVQIFTTDNNFRVLPTTGAQSADPVRLCDIKYSVLQQKSMGSMGRSFQTNPRPAASKARTRESPSQSTSTSTAKHQEELVKNMHLRKFVFSVLGTILLGGSVALAQEPQTTAPDQALRQGEAKRAQRHRERLERRERSRGPAGNGAPPRHGSHDARVEISPRSSVSKVGRSFNAGCKARHLSAKNCSSCARRELRAPSLPRTKRAPKLCIRKSATRWLAFVKKWRTC